MSYPQLIIVAATAILLILIAILGWKVFKAEEITIKFKDIVELIFRS